MSQLQSVFGVCEKMDSLQITEGPLVALYKMSGGSHGQSDGQTFFIVRLKNKNKKKLSLKSHNCNNIRAFSIVRQQTSERRIIFFDKCNKSKRIWLCGAARRYTYHSWLLSSSWSYLMQLWDQRIDSDKTIR